MIYIFIKLSIVIYISLFKHIFILDFRVNNQLNYSRKFVSPERVVVYIPTIPFQSFDVFLSGSKVKPWDLISMFVSARIFAQWPVKHTDKPNDSIIDSHILAKENFFFIVAIHLDISRSFHSNDSPKFPLEIDSNVINIGKGSSRRRYDLAHTSVATPYVTCEIDDVLVNKSSRKASSFPDWWKAKFGHIDNTPKRKFSIPQRTNESVATNEYSVEYEHLDHNKHMTVSAYILFCFNALFNNIVTPNTLSSRSVYRNISLDEFNEGVKSLTMVFHKESRFGDRLIVESWEPAGSTCTVLFYVKKTNGTHCASIKIEFYNPPHDIYKSKM